MEKRDGGKNGSSLNVFGTFFVTILDIKITVITFFLQYN